jgi:hypothetical protein
VEFKTKTITIMSYDKTHVLHPSNEKEFIDSILDLYRKHGQTIEDSIEKNLKKTRAVLFTSTIDKKNGRPVFETSIRMVTVDPLKDRRRSAAEDPDSVPMPGSFMAEADANSKAALEKKAKSPNFSMAVPAEPAPKKSRKGKGRK